MSIFLQLLILIVGSLVSLFIAWRRLKEDYEESDIFSLFVAIILGGSGGFFVSQFLPILGFWGVILGAILSGGFMAPKLDMLLFEVIEASAPAFFIFLIFASLSQPAMWQRPIPAQLIEPTLALVGLIIFVILSRNFRKFTWYPSGKVGLASLLSLAFYFTIRSLLAIFSPSMLGWSNRIFDIALGLSCSIVAAFVVYLRSGKMQNKSFRFTALFPGRKAK